MFPKLFGGLCPERERSLNFFICAKSSRYGDKRDSSREGYTISLSVCVCVSVSVAKLVFVQICLRRDSPQPLPVSLSSAQILFLTPIPGEILLSSCQRPPLSASLRPPLFLSLHLSFCLGTPAHTHNVLCGFLPIHTCTRANMHTCRHTHTHTHTTLSPRCVCDRLGRHNPLAQTQRSQSPHPIIRFSKEVGRRDGERERGRERERERDQEGEREKEGEKIGRAHV